MSEFDTFRHPLELRYASKEMKQIFSQRTRVTTWRKCWIWLIEAQKELGLPVSDEAIKQMKEHEFVADEEFPIAAEEEAKRRSVTTFRPARYCRLSRKLSVRLCTDITADTMSWLGCTLTV